MAFDPAPLLALVARAEALVARLEGVLPHPLTAPDWSASTAFRYRTRGGAAAAGSSRCATSPRSGSTSLVEVDAQKERIVRNTEQFVAGKAGQQRAAHRRARHRQELADQGLPERVRAAGACA